MSNEVTSKSDAGTDMKWTSLHGFCGGGGDALGFQRAGIEVIGAWDEDEKACEDFEMLTGAKPYNGDVTELIPSDLRDICGGRRPDIFISSPPCKGNSGLLSEEDASSEKYQKLNSLAQFGFWIVLEAWKDNPPPIVLLENVSRITSRSRVWLDQTIAMLKGYDYAVAETKHDCGELGGLAQHRDRYMLIARHVPQVPALVRVPEKKRVKGIGEVIGGLPVPLPGREGGPMHHLPRLSAMNWLRLASIPAGDDYRALPEKVRVCDGYQGRYGAVDRNDPSPTVSASHKTRLAPGSTADPRLTCSPRSTAYGVRGWNDPSLCVLASGCHDNSAASIADPRRPAESTHALFECDEGMILCGPELDLKSYTSADPVPIIHAPDGTWHRPLTTLELAAIQGFPLKIDGEWLKFAGNNNSDWRERIGNAIPPPAAESIAKTCIATLEAAAAGNFILSNRNVWV